MYDYYYRKKEHERGMERETLSYGDGCVDKTALVPLCDSRRRTVC